jgi:hypothetical protein
MTSTQRKAMSLAIGAVLLLAWWALYDGGDLNAERAAVPVSARADERTSERTIEAVGHELTTRKPAESESGFQSAPASTPGPVQSIRILVEVVNDLGSPLPGASVFLRRHDDYREIGTTDHAGRVQGDWSDCEFGVVDATHPDYAPTSSPFALESAAVLKASHLPATRGQELVVRVAMKPAGLIEGSVVVAGKPGPSGIKVSAHPCESSWRTWFQTPELFEGDPQHVRTQTDEAGRFLLRVNPSTTYTLIAGGSGLVQSQAMHRVQANGPPVELELVYGYALAVRFVEPANHPLESRVLSSTYKPGSSTSEHDPEAEIGNFTVPAAIWAGLPRAVISKDRGLDQKRVLFYSASVRKERVGPITLSVNANGCESFTQEYWATPLDATVSIDVPLKPNASARGGIRVRIRGALLPGHGADTSTQFSDRKDGTHLLNLRNRDVGTLKLELDDWKEGVCELPEVPAGEYDCWFSTYPNPWFYDPAEGSDALESLTVEPESWTEVEYELPQAGTIELKVFRPDGTPYYGFLGATLSRAPGPHTMDGEVVLAYIGGAAMFFKSAPYRIGGLLPSNYAVWLAGSPEAEEHRPTATVTVGRTTEVTLELPYP